MSDDIAASLANCTRGAMVAPAGFGKTWTIARAVTDHCLGRHLVLTHTHAGVDAIRRRLLDFRCPLASVHIDTIAGWCLRLAAAFPGTSRIQTTTPKSDAEYLDIYAAAARLLHMRPYREILRASYSSVYVDEYQDCNIVQHAVIVSIADTVPCRVVGDPLQSIFDIGDAPLVGWESDVHSQFDAVPGPTEPHRWLKTNPELGTWLRQVRDRLEHDLPIELEDAPIHWIRVDDPQNIQRDRLSACSKAAGDGVSSVVAIHGQHKQAEALARNLGGRYSCIERVDLQELYVAAEKLDQAQGAQRALEVLDYADLFLTEVKSAMQIHRRSLESGKPTTSRKFSEQRAALDAVASDMSPLLIAEALNSLKEISGARFSRRELLDEMRRACRALADGEATSLAEAARTVRNRTRLRGRKPPRCAMGTTLRVKGLEFDHAVVLAPDQYDAQNLYVALTRGARSLSIVSTSSTLRPKVRLTDRQGSFDFGGGR